MVFKDDGATQQMFDKSLQEEIETRARQPVECLGLAFPDDEARREHFLDKLRDKLKDPEFRKIEGFPIGSDEDILALSDPPYYTACPNPFLAAFAGCGGRNDDEYRCDPFAADVRIARHDHYTLGHTYHTKVSPLAIVQYIEHFTRPGDIVLDLFAGSGMTGLAAAGAPLDLSHERPVLAGTQPRLAILLDLGPAATHIAAGYAVRFTRQEVETVRKIIQALRAEEADLYRVKSGGFAARNDAWGDKLPQDETGSDAELEYLVWSEVLVCPHCTQSIVFAEVAYRPIEKEVADAFSCPHCGTHLEKRECRRQRENYFDQLLKVPASRPLQVPVFAAIAVKGKRSYRRATMDDAGQDVRIDAGKLPRAKEVLKGERFFKDALDGIYGVTHVHHFYTPRALRAMASLLRASEKVPYRIGQLLRFVFTSVAIKASKLMNYNADGVGRVMKGTLYASSLVQECNPFWLAEISLQDIQRLARATRHASESIIISTQSSAKILLPEASVDYVWTDPPFGKNLMYAELNQIWDWWLQAFSASEHEAVIDGRRGKDLPAYTSAMTASFAEAYRVLKPGRWMTVEFHNSKNAVWNAIQEALSRVGFIVADVRTLDKKLMTYKQSQQGLVKVDLVISAYKPTRAFEEKFSMTAGTEDGVWQFVRSHLDQLPAFVQRIDAAEVVSERQGFMLFDRMIAFHVRHGISVPLSSAEFYAGLGQRFSQRDGMYFLPEQVAEYDRRRAGASRILQLDLFVVDEASAIQWLKRELLAKPQTMPEIHPNFMQQIAGWEKHEEPLELSDLLRQNFLCYDGLGEVPSQVHSYLSSIYKELRNLSKTDAGLREKATGRWYVPDPNKAGDLEKLREKGLLKEFEEYRASKQRSLKVFRTEAVRAGFKFAYDRQDYKTIVEVARKVPESVLQEDEKLLMYYDVATMRLGDEGKDKPFP